MVYALLYNNNFGDREFVKKMIQSIDKITAWRYDMPNSFYICSQSTAQELTDIFLLYLQNAINYRFLIIEISENRQGFLPKDTWNFIKNNS